jgi:hypothetical protein
MLGLLRRLWKWCTEPAEEMRLTDEDDLWWWAIK